MGDMIIKDENTEPGLLPGASIVHIVGCAIPPFKDHEGESYVGTMSITSMASSTPTVSHSVLHATTYAQFLAVAGIDLLRAAVAGGVSFDWLEQELMGLHQTTRKSGNK